MRIGATPQAVRWSATATLVHAALHFVVPPLMAAERRLFVDQFRRMAPQQPSDVAAASVNHLLWASFAYHLALGSLFVALAAFVVYRRNWARVLLTIVLTLGIFGTAFSFSSNTPMPILYKSLNVVSWLLAFGALALLWGPHSSRDFFRSPR
jgi:peptidoglycan/LPS O-acetylase OafA/YrhL